MPQTNKQIAASVMRFIESTKSANKVLLFFYRLLPSFCFGESISNLIIRKSPIYFGEPKGVCALTSAVLLLCAVRSHLSRRGFTQIYDMEIMGWPLLYMALESIGYFVIVFIIEYVRASPQLLSYCTSVPVMCCTQPPLPLCLVLTHALRCCVLWCEQVVEADEKREEDDADVLAEKERLIRMTDAAAAPVPPNSPPNSQPQREMIAIRGLRKVYAPPRPGMKPHLAVEGLYLGIPEGQCFGYLGVNVRHTPTPFLPLSCLLLM
jgi:hypothetical protein